MLLFTFVVIVLFGIVLYYYVKYTYFSFDNSLPGIIPQVIFGNVLQTGIIGYGETLPTVFRKFQIKFGDVFQFWLGPTRVIVVCNLEDVQHIYSHRHIYDQGGSFINKYSIINPNALIGLTGAKFKRHISALTALFRRDKIMTYMDVIINCTDKLLARWNIENKHVNYIRLHIIDDIQQLLIDIFGFICFDYDLHSLDNNNKDELTHALHTYINTIVMFTQLPDMIGNIYLFCNFEYRRARQIIDRYLNKMIEQELQETLKIKSERKRTSFLASLISSLHEFENSSKTNDIEENKKGLSRVEIMEEMLSFLTASYGTISTAVTWFIYLMSKHSHIQVQIKKELLEQNMQQISIEQLDSLVYLDCVIRELFRFVPPLHSSLRILTANDQLPMSKVQLRKGDQIFISIYNLGRDRRYWSESIDPDQFYPERFSIEDHQTNDKRIASIPFGGGHRPCIGKDLARFALKIICARLMEYVTFEDGGPEVNSGGYKQTDTIIPKNMGVIITFDSSFTL